MAPKFNPADPAVAELISTFQSIGLTPSKATDAARNPKNAALLKETIEQNSLSDRNLDEKQGALVAVLAIHGSKLAAPERTYIVEAILDERLKNVDQVTG